jgi:hypothetical protein
MIKEFLCSISLCFLQWCLLECSETLIIRDFEPFQNTKGGLIVQVDPDYNLTKQKKACLQLAHLNCLLELHACLNFSCLFQEVEGVGYYRKCTRKLDVYNDLSFNNSTYRIENRMTQASCECWVQPKMHLMTNSIQLNLISKRQVNLQIHYCKYKST